MTERVVGPCSPAERGTPCNGLCCAPTGALWRETSSFDPHPGTPDGVDPSTGKRSAGNLARCVWTGGKGVSPYLSVPHLTHMCAPVGMVSVLIGPTTVSG